jgi:hypothetical protein
MKSQANHADTLLNDPETSGDALIGAKAVALRLGISAYLVRRMVKQKRIRPVDPNSRSPLFHYPTVKKQLGIAA